MAGHARARLLVTWTARPRVAGARSRRRPTTLFWPEKPTRRRPTTLSWLKKPTRHRPTTAGQRSSAPRPLCKRKHSRTWRRRPSLSLGLRPGPDRRQPRPTHRPLCSDNTRPRRRSFSAKHRRLRRCVGPCCSANRSRRRRLGARVVDTEHGRGASFRSASRCSRGRTRGWRTVEATALAQRVPGAQFAGVALCATRRTGPGPGLAFAADHLAAQLCLQSGEHGAPGGNAQHHSDRLTLDKSLSG